MGTNKVWYHAGAPCNGCGGLGEMWRRLDAAGVAFGVYSVEGGGLVAEAAAFGQADPLIYRTLATDVAAYELSPDAAAAGAWARLMEKLPAEVKALRGRVWIEIGNEQDKGRADWLGWYYVALAGHAAAEGYRICGPGWATGEPEAQQWATPGWLAYLRLCAARPDRLAVTVHEYSLDADDIMTGYPWLAGRVSFLFEVCRANGIAPPTVFVTEAGWTHNDLPPADKAKEDIDALARLYAQYPTVKAAFLWSLIGGGDKRTLAAELNGLMGWLGEYAVGTRFPDVDEEDGGDEGGNVVSNLLVNPSFEGEWEDADDFPGQHPRGWRVEWNAGAGFPNPRAAEWAYQVGEGVHKSKGMLPAAERDVFVWDGEWTYKLFAGQKAFWARLKQAVALPAGRYRLVTAVWVDCYRWSGFKDYNVEPWQAETMVKVNGATAREWSLMVSGGRRAVATEFEHGGGAAELAVHFRCNWPISNNLWLDGWSLEAVEEEPPPAPPPAKHKAIVLKLPQDVTAEEWGQAAAYGYEYRHTMTASHDDMLTVLRGGNEESYVKLAWPDQQADVGALVEGAGYTWRPVFDEPLALSVWPAQFTPAVTQGFGARPEVYGPLGFPGHEGVDIRANLNTPVRAAAAGEVLNRTTTGNYGNAIRLRHAGGWVTLYAHLNGFAGLQAGEAVAAGQTIGFAGSTGNSTGVHLHFGISHETREYTDAAGNRWPKGIHDPTPWLAAWLHAAPPIEGGIDLLPYLQGEHRRHFDMGHNVNGGGTQTVQVWHLSPTDWLYIKGESGEYERLGLRTWQGQEWVFRLEDTSESADRFYAHYLSDGGAIGAPWMPRQAAIGRWYETPKFVQHYRKGDCAKLDGGPVTDRLRVVSGPRMAVYPDSGARVDEVITIEWSGGEQYDFAAGRGCVAFRDAGRRFWFIGDLSGRPDKAYKKPTCIPLGW